MEGRLRTIGFVVALLGISVVGYSASQSTQESEIATTTQAEALTTNENGFSGLAQVDESTYLAVHDDLVYEDGHRLTLIRLKAGMAPTSTPVTVNNWMDPDGPSSDLESLCAIPPVRAKFFSRKQVIGEEEYGRLFHIELDAQDNSARVLGFSKLPLFLDNNPGQTGISSRDWNVSTRTTTPFS